MATTREQIEALARQMETQADEAYARGWRDAIAALQSQAAQLGVPTNAKQEAADLPPTPPAKPRGRPAKAISLVRDAIYSNPGLRGVDLIGKLSVGETPVVDRTVRSALRRLRKARVIWQRNGKWYPKPKDAAGVGDVETNNGETFGTSPH